MNSIIATNPCSSRPQARVHFEAHMDSSGQGIETLNTGREILTTSDVLLDLSKPLGASIKSEFAH